MGGFGLKSKCESPEWWAEGVVSRRGGKPQGWWAEGVESRRGGGLKGWWGDLT